MRTFVPDSDCFGAVNRGAGERPRQNAGAVAVPVPPGGSALGVWGEVAGVDSVFLDHVAPIPPAIHMRPDGPVEGGLGFRSQVGHWL